MLGNTAGIEIKSSIANIEIKCDFEALKIVFINIIFNAIQALDEKGEIKISSKNKDNEITIEIEDTGIIEGKIEEIFEPLYTTKQEGTGLGLASCKSIIEQHRGTISVSANPTTFTITLPKD